MFIRPKSETPSPSSSLPASGGLQHTPSLKYQPASREDRKTDEQLLDMVRYRERNGKPHPDLPMKPAGTREMTPEEAAATRLFRERYFLTGREANINGTRWDFDRHEYCQTYRREGDEIVANQPELIVGGFNYVNPQSGRLPPNTRVDIHSHPNFKHPANAVPSDQDQRVAHQLRTNALHRPGTKLDGAIMYYPPKDTFYGYTGELVGREKRTEFHELTDPFPMPYQGPPDLSRARMRLPARPPQFMAYNPSYRGPASPSLAAAVSPSAVPLPSSPIPIPGAGRRDFSGSGSPDHRSPPLRPAPSPFSASPSGHTPQSPPMFPFDGPGFGSPASRPRHLAPDAREGFATPPPPSRERAEDPAWQRRANSADSRLPASGLPHANTSDGVVHRPKPRRAGELSPLPTVPSMEEVNAALGDFSLDQRGRPGFGEAPARGLFRRSAVTTRSTERTRQPGMGVSPRTSHSDLGASPKAPQTPRQPPPDPGASGSMRDESPLRDPRGERPG